MRPNEVEYLAQPYRKFNVPALVKVALTSARGSARPYEFYFPINNLAIYRNVAERPTFKLT